MIGQVLERFGLREAPVELTDWQVTVLLLDVPEEWRQRAVEEVSLQTEGLYRVRRSVQFAALLDVVEEAGFRVEKKEQAAVLPLWLMPKAPLLEFDVTGPDGKPAHLVSRTDTSLRQVEFLAALSGIEGVELPQDVAGVLFGVGRFTPGRLDGPKELRKERVEQRAYALELAFGGSFEAVQVEEWESRCAEWGTRLAEIIGEPAHPESSSENPLLALLDGPFAEQTAADVGRLLDAYLSWLDRLAEVGAVRVLWWVATFGRRYYALVEVKVDPERPGLLKMTERRELALDKGWVRSAWRLPARQYRCSVELETKVASSYHLRVRSDDESVSPSGPPTMTAGDGSRVGSTYVDGTAVGADGYALYMSDPARPGHVTLTVPLRLSGDVRRSLTLAYGLAFAAALVAALPVALDKSGISLLTLPATFSATVLLVRERTTLSARVLKYYKWVLVGAVGVLWIASLARVADVYPPDAGDSPSSRPAATMAPTPSPPAVSPTPRPPASRTAKPSRAPGGRSSAVPTPPAISARPGP